MADTTSAEPVRAGTKAVCVLVARDPYVKSKKHLRTHRGGRRKGSKRAKVSDRDCLDRKMHHGGAEDVDSNYSLNLQPIAAASY